MKTQSPTKAIRKYCIECSGGSIQEVRNCIIKNCELYQFRMGRNPNRKGIGKIDNISNSPTKSNENHDISKTQ